MSESYFRDRLVNWTPSDHLAPTNTIGKWYKGSSHHHYPNKQQLQREGMSAIATGWIPQVPIIKTDTRVLAVGSCFAKYFTLWLAEQGFNRTFPESPYNALLRFNTDFESPAAVAQQFRWAFDEVNPKSLLWIDKNRQEIVATDAGKNAVRATLEHTDVLILTLGLSEVWYDEASGEPLWRALTEDTYNPDRHVFKVETVSQTVAWLEAIEQLRKRYLPKLKIIFSVSPVPLKTTFRPVSAVTANAVSKAVLRAALDEFLRHHADLLNHELFYFPSYEIVTSYFIDPFREDNRHLAPLVSGKIITYFVENYCDSTLTAQQKPDEVGKSPVGDIVLERIMHHSTNADTDDRMHELLARISELEGDVSEYIRICDERQLVINEVKKAADERLRLVEKLHKIADDRLQVIQNLTNTIGKPAVTNYSSGEIRLFTPAEILAKSILTGKNRSGEGGVEIVAACVTNKNGEATLSVQMTDELRFYIYARALRVVKKPYFGIVIHDRDGNLIFTGTTLQAKGYSPQLNKDQEIVVGFKVRMTIQAGEYTFRLSCAEPHEPYHPNKGVSLDAHESLGPITVLFDYEQNRAPFYGFAQLPMEML